jgi:hypothetical protein
MKSSIKFLAIILIITSCNQSAKQNNTSTSDTTNISSIDTSIHYNVSDFKYNKSKYKVDTAINDVLIDGKTFSFIALQDKDKSNATEDDGGIPYDITFVFIDPTTNKSVVFKKLFLQQKSAVNIYSIFKTNQKKLNEEGDLYIDVSLIAGGSGGLEALYYVNLKNGKIIFNKLFNYEMGMHSTTEIYFNKNKNEILEIDGITSTIDPDGDINSLKFSIEKYDNINGKYVKSILGQTKYKYTNPGTENDDPSPVNLLTRINSKEPTLFESMHLNINDFKEN